MFRSLLNKLISFIVFLVVILFLIQSCNNSIIYNLKPIKPENKNVAVGFFNGVNTSKHDADANVRFLGISMFNQWQSSIPVVLFYNYTYGLVNDLIEVFHQKTAENPLLNNRYELFFDLVGGNTEKIIHNNQNEIESIRSTFNLINTDYIDNNTNKHKFLLLKNYKEQLNQALSLNSRKTLSFKSQGSSPKNIVA